MKNVAFITYNAVGYDVPSGWTEREGRRAFVMQGNYAICSLSEPESEERKWLEKNLQTFDCVVAYIGVHFQCTEGIFHLFSQLPTTRIILVYCDCKLQEKRCFITQYNLVEARAIVSECGGRETLQELYTNFLEKGELALAMPHAILFTH